jgi:hypothetical protein
MGNRDRTSSAEIVILANEIQGNPRPRDLGQWVPHEDRPWWTEDALAVKRGLSPERTTGRFVERADAGWRIHVLNDAERAALFRAKAGSFPRR